jgi:hypothetical protein
MKRRIMGSSVYITITTQTQLSSLLTFQMGLVNMLWIVLTCCGVELNGGVSGTPSLVVGFHKGRQFRH